VTQVERIALLPEVARGYDFDHYYRLRLELPGQPFSAIAFVREIPDAWEGRSRIDERASLAGLFLKVGGDDQGQSSLVFAAHRAAWRPERVNAELGVTADDVFLAKLGVDLAVFDDVRQRNGKPIGSLDREGFYQLLAAVGRTDNKTLRQRAAREFDLAPLLTKPEALHGRLLPVAGIARRVTRVLVNDADIRARFGIREYYQVDLFVPVGEQVVRLGEPGEAAPVFNDQYPVTVCVLELPPSLLAAAQSRRSEIIREKVQLPAFFFKLWQYKSGYTSQFEKRQVSPMFIGRKLELAPEDPAFAPWIGAAAAALFMTALAAAWLGLWRAGRDDAKFARSTLNRKFEMEKGKSLNALGIEAREAPNFRRAHEAREAQE
jgi:hypothetical protein